MTLFERLRGLVAGPPRTRADERAAGADTLAEPDGSTGVDTAFQSAAAGLPGGGAPPPAAPAAGAAAETDDT